MRPKLLHPGTHTRAMAIMTTLLLLSGSPAASGDQSAIVELRGGTATFDAPTNVGAISVHGTSKALAGRAVLKEAADALRLERLEATVPIQTLNTGLGLRDSHMRQRVFTAADGQVPDLRFTADQAACTPLDAARQASCQVSGLLTIRGTARPFAMALTIKRQGDAFRAAGDGVVKLSLYGIERPSQFGVTVEDEIKIRLEFTATSSVVQASARPDSAR